MTSIRIVVVDDHPVTRTGTITILQRDASLVVVGEAEDGSHTIELCRTHEPDVLILDVRLPSVSGISVARACNALPRPPRILMLSAFADTASVHAALEAGASGYVLKSIPGNDLLAAVYGVMRGERVILGVAGALEGRRVMLTPQEVVVLTYVADGLTSKEIAQHLGLVTRTVETHLTRIYRKLDATNRTGALAVARREGLLGTE